MTFEQLLYAEVLSHHSSMQEAADILHISKSGLSLAISQLEEEIGIKIFERTSKGTVLTTNGLKTLSAITDVLHAKNELMNTISIMSETKKNSIVKIRYMNTMLKPFMHTYLGSYQKICPETILDIRCGERNVILEMVRRKEIDAGFIVMPILLSDLGEELAFEQVCHSKILMVCSPDNSILGKEKVTLDDIKEQKFCLFNDEAHDYVFNQLQYMCGPLSLIFRTDDIWAINEAIKKFDAVCLIRDVQKQLSREKEFEDLKFVSLDHLVDDNSVLGWVTNTHCSMSIEAKKMISMMTEQIKTDTAKAVPVL